METLVFNWGIRVQSPAETGLFLSSSVQTSSGVIKNPSSYTRHRVKVTSIPSQQQTGMLTSWPLSKI
jgi:hypothetical protein